MNWVEFTKQKPKRPGDYLIFLDDSPFEPSIKICLWDIEDQTFVDKSGTWHVNHRPTHWMELPDYPLYSE